MLARKLPASRALAAELVGQNYSLVSHGAALLGSGGAQLPHTAGDLRRHIGKALGGLAAQQFLRRRAEVQPYFSTMACACAQVELSG